MNISSDFTAIFPYLWPLVVLLLGWLWQIVTSNRTQYQEGITHVQDAAKQESDRLHDRISQCVRELHERAADNEKRHQELALEIARNYVSESKINGKIGQALAPVSATLARIEKKVDKIESQMNDHLIRGPDQPAAGGDD